MNIAARNTATYFCFEYVATQKKQKNESKCRFISNMHVAVPVGYLSLNSGSI